MTMRNLTRKLTVRSRRVSWILALLLLSLSLSGCGLLGFGAAGPEATATPVPADGVDRGMVPTFTPTPDVPPTDTPPPPPPPTDTPPPAEPAAETAESSDDASAESGDEAVDAPAEEPTPVPLSVAKFVVTEPLVNVRLGPGTNFGLAGTVEANQAFDIVGKTAAADWWQICCVNGQEVWIFAQLGQAENADAVALAENIPPSPTPAPVAAVPTATPAPAPAAPVEAPTEPPAPPPSVDPCAGIGGDGCKFKVRAGPSFAPNGGTELKLQLFFIHSGIDGGQPQGSYFVVLTKDGVNLGVSDAVRSVANSSSEGALGRYNYEYKIGIDKIPGNNVAGNYTMFVLDGNGERDSQDLNFTVPEGQGEVWVTWDQG